MYTMPLREAFSEAFPVFWISFKSLIVWLYSSICSPGLFNVYLLCFSVIAQLTVCLNTYSSGCANIKKSLISAAASSLLQLKTICTSKTVDCGWSFLTFLFEDGLHLN